MKRIDICHYWYFKEIGCKCEPYACNGFDGLIQKALNFNEVAIVSITGSDYRIHFWYIRKNYAINIMKRSNF